MAMRPLRVTSSVAGVGGLLAAVALLFTACSQPEPPRVLPEPGTLLARVTDLAGAPVAAAVFDGVGAVTDADGVATGTLAGGSTGFTRLSAPGYATLWTKPLPTSLEDKFILAARLTPLEAVVPVDPTAPATLWLGPKRTPDVVVDVPARTFPLPAVLGVARVRAQDLGAAAFAPRPGALERALWLGASISGVDTPAWEDVTLTLRRPEYLGTPALAAFSPTDGKWLAQPDACARLDAERVRCATRTLGLVGLFGAATPDETGDAWVDAEFALAREAFDADAAPRLAGLSLERLSRAARDVSAAAPGAEGLHALLVAAAAAQHAGDDALVKDLLERALTLVQLQVDGATGAGCERLLELSHLVEEGRATGLASSPRKALEARIDELLWTCDAWTGWVRYDFLLPGALPGDADAGLVDAVGTWSERHAVRFTIDLDSRVQGTDDVDVRFPRVTFRDDFDGAPACGDDYRELAFAGSPEANRLNVTLSGSVAADVFHFEGAALAAGDEALALRTRAQRWFEGGDACLLVQDVDRTDGVVPRYTTQAVDGFGGPSPLTLSRMLTDGWQGDNPLGTGAADRSGTARVVLPAPPGAWPFTEAVVSWRFFPVTSPRE